ncbi:hypothetical protein SDC49_25435 [Lactobacillus sp. R2/2]|nr:hypothetical protein [Lactobacillus sp. R2/2]MEB3365622.1 hypothetical protein [Lactobacillus sp. R2/2]
MKKSIAEGGLPFEVRDPFYSEENQAELNQRFKRLTIIRISIHIIF